MRCPNATYLLLLCTFGYLFCPSISCAEALFVPTVKKIKLHNKKKQRKNRFKTKRWASHAPINFKKKQQNQSSTIYTVLMILFFLSILIGVLMFGFGVAIFPILITGIALITTAYLIPWFILLEALINNKDSEDFVGFTTPMAIFLFIFELIAGLTFLIIGLSIGLSIYWIMGIVLLALLPLLIILIKLAFSNMH